MIEVPGCIPMFPVEIVVVSPSKEREVPPKTAKVLHSPSKSVRIKEVGAEGTTEAGTVPEGDKEAYADSLAEEDAELLMLADADGLELGALLCSSNPRF